MSLRNVTPVFATNDMHDRGHGDSETGCNVLVHHSIGSQLADRGDVLSCQQRTAVVFTDANSWPTSGVSITGQDNTSPFGPHVSDVVELRSKEQVIWPNAKRRVATMEHLHPFGDGAISDSPRDTVGAVYCGSRPNVSVGCVWTFGRSSGPQPAAISPDNLRPKAWFDRTRRTRLTRVNTSRHGVLND